LEDPSRFAEILSATAKLEESHGLHQQEIEGLSAMVSNSKAKADEVGAKTQKAFDKLAEIEVLMNASQLDLKLNDTNRDMLIMKSELKELHNLLGNHKMELQGGMDEHRRLFQQQLVEHNQRWNDHLTNNMSQGIQAGHLDELRAHFEQRLGEHADAHKAALNQHGAALAQQRGLLDEHRSAFDNHRSAFDSHRAAFEEHTALFDDHRAAFEDHRSAFDDHRGSLDEKFSGLSMTQTASLDPASFQEEIDIAFDRRMAAIESKLRIFAFKSDVDEIKKTMNALDANKVQTLVKLEIQEFESLINDIRAQHDKLVGNHKDLAGFKPQDLHLRCDTIEKNHALFSERLARAETSYNRAQVGANSADIEKIKSMQNEHAQMLTDINSLVQAKMEGELQKLQLDLRSLVEVEVRKIGNADLEAEILQRTKNVAELHSKVGKEMAAMRKTIEMYRTEMANGGEIGGGLTPKVEESLDQYIRALVARDIQLERETRFTQVSELRSELQAMKGRGPNSGPAQR